jgi:hypothetical protein
MHDDSVLVAIDDATRTHNFCTCGKYLAVVETPDAMWLECPVLSQPTRLPAAIASVLRSTLHDRRFVVEIPEALRRPAAAGAATAVPATTQVCAARA